ncbi:hypothetical protein AAE478_003254 [Parahypoxylon ruwenzoriense]
MAGPRPLSDTEMRLFDRVCEATHATSDSQRNLLKSFVCDELGPEWTRLVELMESNGPLGILTEDELNTQHLNESPFSSIKNPEVDQKTVDHSLVKAASHDILQYNNILEKILVKYKDYVRRSIVNMKSFPETSKQTSVAEQKITALTLRKELLKKEINSLQDKVQNRVDLLEGLVRAESKIAETDGDFYEENYKPIALKSVLESTFPSYDHILSRLKALHWELSYDTVEDEVILYTARRHASQIVLSLATKCRASLDTVFLEAASTYNQNAPYVSDYARAINDERNAVHAEIQSLWDEMVPLAHMVVEKDFLKPILKRIEMCNEQQTVRDATISVYTSAMLRFMNFRLRVIADRIGMLVYHHQTLFAAFSYVNSKAETQSSKALETTNAHVVQNDEKGERKGSTLLEAIRRKMELYGSIPINIGKPYRTPHMQITKLDRYVLTRQQKGDDLARNMHRFFEMAVSAELTDAELGGQLLLDSVIADSASGCRSGGRVYEDQQVEDSVSTMKSQVEEVQTVFRQLRDEGIGAPSSAPDFVAYAYNKAAKQLANKSGEGCYHLENQDEISCQNCKRCLKFASLIRQWDDSTNFTN